MFLALKPEPRNFKTKEAINVKNSTDGIILQTSPKQKRRLPSDMVVHACNRNIWEVKAKRLRRTWAILQDHLQKPEDDRGWRETEDKK